MKKIYLTLLLAIAACATWAQTVDIDASGLGFLDNREYKDFVARSRTYSGTRISFDAGINIDSTNSFVAGANALHEFGGIPFFLQVDPVIYYRLYNHDPKRNWLFLAGEFPRKGLTDNYPRALLNDTLTYYRPNIEGMLLRYQTPHFMEMGWIDWLSRQTDTAREQFMWGFQGKYRPSLSGPFYVANYYMLEHNAGAAILLPNDHIFDDGGGELVLGLDFSKKQKLLDSMSFEAGTLFSMQRERGVNTWKTPVGAVAKAYFSYRRFAVFDEFYIGEGSEISYGDAFYEKHFYNRLDFIITPFKADGLMGQFVFTAHRTPGFTSNQEAFRFTYELGRKKVGKFKNY